MFLILCFIIYQKNGEQIKNTLVSAYNKTILFLLGKEIELPQTESIFFDKDFYIKKANRNAASPNTRELYWKSYENYEALYDYTGLRLPETENVKFQNTFIVYLYIHEKYGCFDTTVYYKDHLYDMSGIFRIQNYTEDDTAINFDQGNWATFIYEYGNDKEAFFIRDIGENQYRVYFEIDNILYQLIIPDTEEDIAAAKELITELDAQ